MGACGVIPDENMLGCDFREEPLHTCCTLLQMAYVSATWRRAMQPRFEQFIRERQYLRNVTTAHWNGTNTASSGSARNQSTEAELKAAVLQMRE